MQTQVRVPVVNATRRCCRRPRRVATQIRLVEHDRSRGDARSATAPVIHGCPFWGILGGWERPAESRTGNRGPWLWPRCWKSAGPRLPPRSRSATTAREDSEPCNQEGQPIVARGARSRIMMQCPSQRRGIHCTISDTTDNRRAVIPSHERSQTLSTCLEQAAT